MNHQNHQTTAKIYQFPVRGRENADRRKVAQNVTNAHLLGNSTAPIYGGAWYHDAAIKEDDRKR